MYRPNVSIIIPVFNGSNFLKEAIDSALGQTYSNLEIIVVNDGSTDNGKSEEIALSYGNRIRYLSKTNGGVSSALNFALENSTGEWFSWLSHDDLYYPEKIEKQIAFLNTLLQEKSELQLKKVVLHSATVSIDINGKIIKRPNYSDIDIDEDSEKIILDNIYNYRLSGCSFLVNCVAFKDIGGFREDIKTVSDVEYWHRLLFNGYKFYCLKNDVLVKNRSHGKQVGKTKISLFNKELNDLYRSIFDSYESIFNPNIYNVERFYYGLIKRNINNAAKYIKHNRIKNNVSFFKYFFIIPIKTLYWKIKGIARDVARYFFRKINVKSK